MATDPVLPPVEQAQEIALSLWSQGHAFSVALLRPWNAYQIGIMLALMAAAHILRAFLGPRLHAWMRTREGWPKWRMRILVMTHRRLRLIFFVILSWLTVAIMQEVTWPSRSYLLAIAASLAVTWLVIAFVTRLIANGFLRGAVRYAGWVWATLIILGLTDEAQRLMDSLAVHLGQTRISVWLIVQAIVILGALFFAARMISTTISSRIRRNEGISPSMQVLAVKFLQVALYGAAFFIGLRTVGFDLTGLAVLSGAIGVGLGFGLQKVVSNLVSGIIILLDKSIKPGDVISLGETFGWINSLGARYVSVVTRDGKEYLIPNEDLITSQVVNWSHSNEFVRLDIYFGTAYGDDPHNVRKIAIDAAASVPRVLSMKAPVCHIVGFGDSSVDYILRFWIRDPAQGLTNIRGNVYLALWDAFQQNGISIPFPQREVRMLNDPGDASPPTVSEGRKLQAGRQDHLALLKLALRIAIFRSGPAPGQDQVRSQEDDVLSISAQAATAANTATTPNGTRSAPSDAATSQQQLQHILASLDADKAEDIVQIDLRGKSAIGDYMIICSGRSSRQVSGIAEKLVDKLKHDLGRASRIEGRETGDWVLIDTGDVIVHIFRPEVREFYQLEKMWAPAGGPAAEMAAPTSPG